MLLDVRGQQGQVQELRDARSDEAWAKELDARENEEGAGPFVVPMTPAMSRYMIAVLRRSGQEPR